jgi:hypothetical protein
VGKTAAGMDGAAAAAATATTATTTVTVTGPTRGMDATAARSATDGSATSTPRATTTRIPCGTSPATGPASSPTNRFWVWLFLTFCLPGALTTLCDSSNNPFAVTASSAPPVPSPQPPQQASLSNFSLPSTYESHEPSPRQDFATPSQPAPAPSPQSAVKRRQTHTDQDHAHLASLFAAHDGEGVDTFGNVGALRYATHFLFSCLVLF